jgi:membrane protease subunit (stomatin/prohibitin family)
MKQPFLQAFHLKLSRMEETMNTEYIWETFDSLWKTVNRQGRRVEELEARVVDLEQRLKERAEVEQRSRAAQSHLAEMPVERAA